MQEETQQFSQMDMEGNLMVRISRLLECFVKKNKIYIVGLCYFLIQIFTL